MGEHLASALADKPMRSLIERRHLSVVQRHNGVSAIADGWADLHLD